ncbi:hypothetical protein JXQ70_12235, partial [bacterium]|nr:hypothetical protein [bacterium]
MKTWQFIKKEIRLQRDTILAMFFIWGMGLSNLFLIYIRSMHAQDTTYTSVLVLRLVLLSPKFIGPFHFLIINMVIFLFPVAIGVHALTEDRRAGTVESQFVLPLPIATQWWLKAGFMMTLSLLANGLFLELYDGQLMSWMVEQGYNYPKLPLRFASFSYCAFKGVPPVIIIFFFTALGLFSASISRRHDIDWAYVNGLGIAAGFYLVRMLFDPLHLTFPFSSGYPRFFLHPASHIAFFIVLGAVMLGLSRANFRRLELISHRQRVGQIAVLLLVAIGLTELCLRIEYAIPLDQSPGKVRGLTRLFGNESLYLDVDYSLRGQDKLILKVLSEEDRLRARFSKDLSRETDKWLWNCAILDLHDFSVTRIFPRYWNKKHYQLFFNQQEYFSEEWISCGPVIRIRQEIDRLHPKIKSCHFSHAQQDRSIYQVRVTLDPDETIIFYVFKENKADKTYTEIDHYSIFDHLHCDVWSRYVLSDEARWLARIPILRSSCLLEQENESMNQLILKRIDLSDEYVIKSGPIRDPEGRVSEFADLLNICEYTNKRLFWYDLAISINDRFLAVQRLHSDGTDSFSIIDLTAHEEIPLFTPKEEAIFTFNAKMFSGGYWLRNEPRFPIHKSHNDSTRQNSEKNLPQREMRYSYYFKPMTWSADDKLAILYDRTVYLFRFSADGQPDPIAEIDVSEAYLFHSCSGPKSRLLFVDNDT